jgi:hypothetical protein
MRRAIVTGRLNQIRMNCMAHVIARRFSAAAIQKSLHSPRILGSGLCRGYAPRNDAVERFNRIPHHPAKSGVSVRMTA